MASATLAPSPLQAGVTVEALRAVCTRFAGPKLLQGISIPRKKLANARKALGLLPTDEVVALIDFTAFGSASNALVFATSGIYFCNTGDPPQSISWGGLRRLKLKHRENARSAFITFSDGTRINCSGAQDMIEGQILPIIAELIGSLNTAREVDPPSRPANDPSTALDFAWSDDLPAHETAPTVVSAGASDISGFDFALGSENWTLSSVNKSPVQMPEAIPDERMKRESQSPVGGSATPPAEFTQRHVADSQGPDTRTSLAKWVDRFGERFSTDPQLCRSLLNDVGKDFSKRELNALVGAVMLQVPARINAGTSTVPWPTQRHQLAQLLHNDLGLLEPLAYWCVDAWAIGLRKIDPTQLDAAELPGVTRPAASTAPVSGATPSPPANTSMMAAPTSNAHHIHVVLLEVDGDEDFAEIKVEVINETPINFTELAIGLSLYDIDGDMITKDTARGRLKPKGRYKAELIVECSKDIVGKIVVDTVESFSQINGNYLHDCAPADQAILKLAGVSFESLVPAVTAVAPTGVVWDLID